MNDEAVWVATVKAGRVSMVAGMLEIDGIRCFEVTADGTGFVAPSGGTEFYSRAEYGLVADLRDWPTRLLCLAELAKRVGLDPDRGVWWVRDTDGWRLSVPPKIREAGNTHAFYPSSVADGGYGAKSEAPGVDTDDPLLALALCLRATAP